MFPNIERRYIRGNLTIIFATTILLLLSSSLLAGNLQIPTTSLKKADAQQTTTTTAAAANTCTNLAISGVIASGSDSSVNLPKNTIDNNLNTRWSNLGIGSWIRLDLGIQKVICSVDIAWYNGNQRQNNFVISVSNDGSTFRDIFTGRSSGTTLSSEKYDIPDVIARYVKITVNGNTQNNYASITEIDVYGSNISSIPQPPPSLCSTNLPVTGVIASGSDSSVNLPKNTIDNNLNTRWSNLGIGSWIRLDLGIQKVICSVDIAWYNGNQRQNNFVISVSNDGSAFTPVFTGKSTGTTLSSERYNLPPNTAGRYVKITVNGNTQNNYASITEIDVYGPSAIIIKDKSYNINVLVIKYFPLTADKKNIDINVTGEVGDPYNVIKQKTVDITNNLISSLGKASAYLGYMNSSAKPALSYHINATIEHEEKVPFSPNPPPNRPTYPDYYGIMQSHNICNYVDTKNVTEVWLFAYQGNPTKLGIDESKMSGPFGDISNSFRYNDMPPCKKTYVVYSFNYGRGTAEAMESWGHQLEAELSNINYDLFRNRFQGPSHPQNMTENPGITFGRCGSDHNPPNAVHEYDRWNPSPWLSDCLDWNPDGLGVLSLISCQNWRCDFPTCDVYLYDFYCKEADANNPVVKYSIWLWQNLPGISNTKTYQGQPLRSWWDVYGDFDNVMANSRRLTR